jgi:LmbE family N-acetylglucosaminyl deacetylase
MVITDQVLTQPDRHIFLSPHYDDIALSAGGTAAALSAQGRTPEVALIFGDHPDPAMPLTPFAEQLHHDWGMTAEAVIAGRRAEEAVASLRLGACDRFLPFRDAIYRGERYLNDDQLFGTPHADEAGLPAEIIAALPISASDRNRSRIYAPLAIGMHVDHQHAFRAGRQLHDDGWEVWFYEDLPYALKPDHLAARRSLVESDGLAPGPIVPVESVWHTKIDAIMAYPSQLPTIFGQYVGVGSSREAIDEAMAAYASGAGNGTRAERFWTSARG